VIGDGSEGGDCDEVNQEDSEQNEVDGMKKGADYRHTVDIVLACSWLHLYNYLKIISTGLYTTTSCRHMIHL